MYVIRRHSLIICLGKGFRSDTGVIGVIDLTVHGACALAIGGRGLGIDGVRGVGSYAVLGR